VHPAKANSPYSSSFPSSTKRVMSIGARPASAATAMDVRGLSEEAAATAKAGTIGRKPSRMHSADKDQIA